MTKSCLAVVLPILVVCLILASFFFTDPSPAQQLAVFHDNVQSHIYHRQVYSDDYHLTPPPWRDLSFRLLRSFRPSVPRSFGKAFEEGGVRRPSVHVSALMRAITIGVLEIRFQRLLPLFDRFVPYLSALNPEVLIRMACSTVSAPSTGTIQGLVHGLLREFSPPPRP